MAAPTVSDVSIEDAIRAVGEFLKVPDADLLALSFPVWEDGMRGLVVAYVPGDGTTKDKLGRFLDALNAEYNSET